ncbi:MAG: Ig-like domain-containing protein [Promethearchaeota archaeon]
MINKKILALIIIVTLTSAISIISLSAIMLLNRTSISDNFPPVVNITNPSEGETLSGTILITFTATEQGGVITETQIFINGMIVKNSSYYYNWNTTKEADGTCTIECRAKNEFGWGFDEVHVSVDNSDELDTIAPTIIITSPTTGTTVFGIITINMFAIDANGISSRAIYIDGLLKSNTKSYTWNTTQEIDGSHTILCEATDPSNNTGFDTISVNVNNTEIEPLPETFKIMTFNIKDSGEDPAYPDWKTVVEEENADIIIFIETGYWDDNGNQKLNQYITELNSYFTDEDPYFGYCTQGITYATDGAAIMCRYPIIGFNQIAQVPLDNYTNYDVTHDFFDVELFLNGKSIHVIGSHLKAMSGLENEKIRELEQEGIINYMDSLGNLPLIYLGDLNSFSPEDWGLNTIQSGLGYGPLSMMIPPYNNPDTGDDYSIYSSLIHNWTDVHRTLNPTDWGITYPSYDSRIDFIYVNQFLSPYIINSTTGDTPHAYTGSDHFSIDVFINLSEI